MTVVPLVWFYGMIRQERSKSEGNVIGGTRFQDPKVRVFNIR